MATFSQYENLLGAGVLSQNAEAALAAQQGAEEAYLKSLEILESASGLKSTMTAAQDTITTLQELLTSIETLAATCETNASAVSAAYTSLQSDIATNRAALSAISADLATAQAAYDNASAQNQSTAATANTAIANLNSTVTSAQNTITAAQSSLQSSYNTYLASLQSAQTTGIAALASKGSEIIEDIESAGDNVIEDITEKQEDVEDDIDSYIANIQTQQSTTTAAINSAVSTANNAKSELISATSTANTAKTNLNNAIASAEDVLETAEDNAVASATTRINAVATEKTAAIAQTGNNQLSAMNTSKDSALAAIQAEREIALSDIEDEADGYCDDIDDARTTAVSAIQAQQATSVSAINVAQNSALSVINTAQTNALNNITASTDINTKVTKPSVYITVANMSAAFVTLAARSETAPYWVMIHINTDVLYYYSNDGTTATLYGLDGMYTYTNGTLTQSALGTGSGSDYVVDIEITLDALYNAAGSAISGFKETTLNSEYYLTYLAITNQFTDNSETILPFWECCRILKAYDSSLVTYTGTTLADLTDDTKYSINLSSFEEVGSKLYTLRIVMNYWSNDGNTLVNVVNMPPLHSMISIEYDSNSNVTAYGMQIDHLPNVYETLSETVDSQTEDIESLQDYVSVLNAFASTFGTEGIRPYVATTTFRLNNLVIYNNKLYKCISSCKGKQPDTNASYWEYVTPTNACTSFKAALGLDITTGPRYTVFNGTTSAWNALTTDEKSIYGIVNFTD